MLDFIFDKNIKQTVVAISNDHNLMMKADRILLFDKGQVIADGKFDELSNDPNYSMFF
jgi:ABC-type transport system involved in cytochrome bd biosynthesis fused ATPase/permease subunit